MSLRVSGKNVDIGEALRTHVVTRVSETLDKYFNGAWNGHVTVEKDGGGFRTECALHLGTGITIQAEGKSQDPYPSVDQATDRVEKQLRRYKRKLRDYHNGNARAETVESAYRVVEAPGEEEEVPADFNPVVIAEATKTLKTMTVGSAVMDLDLSQAPFVVFLNAGSGNLNVVYRRRDGNIGWIDPTLPGSSS
ncbi:ribosome hibernation-promoting factor, HPF/YfiA family [Prosthecomicrobium sp. N25]|uniref:ribosome hibernation-promoting factor, HPF/YfiA family n=1 Tax=Prosthecomicrobium sp. N25 TaxID=3129254 RepID=UPI0030784F6E